MGKLQQGVWLTDEQLASAQIDDKNAPDGSFQRVASGFRQWVTADGSSGFDAEPGRYHLYVAHNCPWAHRTLIYRAIKQLEDVIPVSCVLPARSDQGWIFSANDTAYQDALFSYQSLHQIYTRADPNYSGRVTVPVLWDTQTETIVNNESADIIRMFNSEFDAHTDNHTNYYPEHLADQIDELNDTIYQHVNNGVYRAGFARSQSAYNAAVHDLFEALDTLDARLQNQPYLTGNSITEADWRLLPTLVRFDVAYYTAFKCNIKAIRDYPNLSRLIVDLCQQPGVADTIDPDIYRRGYHSKSESRNPHGIVPIGPDVSFV